MRREAIKPGDWARRTEAETTDPVGTDSRGTKVLIVGGGIAGLSCGCYLQMNGYSTEILEAGVGVGGLCAAWDRGPYVFDGCLRWLIGTSPSSGFHRIWKELGVIGQRKIIDHPEVMRIEGRNGETLTVPFDLDQATAEFKRVAPEDTKHIDRLARDARRCAPIQPPTEAPLELMSVPGKIKLGLNFLSALPVIARWKNVPVARYLSRYRNEFLREALLTMTGDERVSTLVLVMLLAWRSRGDGGYVLGGSRAFTQSIAERYTRLGGIIRCETPVDAVTVQDGRATGVRCADGSLVTSDAVVSCADGYTTLYKMLGGRYMNKTLRKAYQHPNLFPALILASIGVNATFDDLPHTLNFPLAEPLTVDPDTQHDRMGVSAFTSDSLLCPEGKTIITVTFPSRCEYWTALEQNEASRYGEVKGRLLQEIIRMLDRRFPGLAQRVENADIATPATFVRYTGNWQGSHQGWLPTPQMLGLRPPRALPGLQRFYMAGHWAEPGGGLPFVALSARHVAQLLCHEDGRVFEAKEP